MTLALQNLHFLDQARILVEELSDELYASCDSHGHACAGAHLRHTLDCYRCFLRGLEGGRVDYDARDRDNRLETERTVALDAMAEITAGLEKLDISDRDRTLEVRVDAVAWAEADCWTSSSIGRELQFLLSHTVHHFAIIAITLRSLGFDPGSDFGVAPSTLEHQACSEAPGAERQTTTGAVAASSGAR